MLVTEMAGSRESSWRLEKYPNNLSMASWEVNRNSLYGIFLGNVPSLPPPPSRFCISCAEFGQDKVSPFLSLERHSVDYYRCYHHLSVCTTYSTGGSRSRANHHPLCANCRQNSWIRFPDKWKQWLTRGCGKAGMNSLPAAPTSTTIPQYLYRWCYNRYY